VKLEHSNAVAMPAYYVSDSQLLIGNKGVAEDNDIEGCPLARCNHLKQIAGLFDTMPGSFEHDSPGL
jgi:hypothetical protein